MSTAPKIVRGPVKHTDIEGRTSDVWYVLCPGCGIQAMIDKDQFTGKVSMDCGTCDYHETHNLSVVSHRPSWKGIPT